MVFQTEKAIEEVGDKLDANDKTAVEADLAALKDLIAKAPVDNMTDEQVAEIKAAKKTDGKRTETVRKSIRAGTGSSRCSGCRSGHERCSRRCFSGIQ